MPLALPNHLLHDLHTYTKTLSVSVVIKLSSTKVDKHTCCLSRQVLHLFFMYKKKMQIIEQPYLSKRVLNSNLIRKAN